MFIFGDHRFKCVVPKSKNVLNRVLLTNSTLKKAGYVNTWLKINQESAGYPGWDTIPDDKARYVAQ